MQDDFETTHKQLLEQTDCERNPLPLGMGLGVKHQLEAATADGQPLVEGDVPSDRR